MNISSNNIGGSPQHARSPHIEKRPTEAAAPEQQQAILSGGKISFVNALEATSLANVLWTVNNEASANNDVANGGTAQVESPWFSQAYTEH